MDQYLIYMDQSHSIGTHFDMPNDFKAILTIGKNVSRDSLAQGCMRMRKLGLKEKIHHNILFVCSANISNKIENLKEEIIKEVMHPRRVFKDPNYDYIEELFGD